MTASKLYLVQPRVDGTMEAKAIHPDRLPDDAWRHIGINPTSSGDAADLMSLYVDTPWLRAGVDARANAVSSLPFTFVREGGDELDVGEVPEFPFEFEIEDVLNVLEGWMCLFGAAYLFRGVNLAGRPRDVRPLHPSTITPVFDPARGLAGFNRTLGGQTQALAVDELVYFWTPNRKSELGPGAAPAQTALKAAGLLKDADGYGKKYFENGVISPTLIKVPAGTPENEKLRLQSWLERASKGLKKAFNALAVGADIQITALPSPVELGKLALPELTDKKREDIATALGVPQSLLFSSATSFATADVDDRHFYTKTIIPAARRIERALNRQLFVPLGWRLKFRPELLEVFQRLEAEKATALKVLVEGGIYSKDEAREELGREQIPGGRGSWDGMDAEKERRFQQQQARIDALRGGQQNPPSQMQTSSQPDDAPIKRELERWKAVAFKRLREGKAEKAVEFESSILPFGVQHYLRGALAGVSSPDAVRLAFAAAGAWSNYP